MQSLLPMLFLGDRQKHSLWIDPASQSPPWPHCKHVNTFMKTQPPKGAPAGTPFVTREEMVWENVILPYILTGHIDTSGKTGEYKCWAPEEEKDLVAERIQYEKFESARAYAERKKKFWKGVQTVRGWTRL